MVVVAQPFYCILMDICLHLKTYWSEAFHCLSVRIVSSGGIRFRAGKLERNILLILCARSEEIFD